VRGGIDHFGCGVRKTRGVGIVADQPVIADDDGIDGADPGCVRRQFVEQIEHGLLIGKGDVDAGKTEPANAFEHQLQFVSSGAGDLDKLIVAT
jgi:hypothetical protein